jgi:hypothetical protein
MNHALLIEIQPGSGIYPISFRRKVMDAIPAWRAVISGDVQVSAREPSPPALDTAAASLTPAMLPIGAWRIGYVRSKRLARMLFMALS